MDNFHLKLYLKEHWESEPFLAFERGYLISLSVYPAGGEGNYLSIYVNLMKGPYDDELEQSGQWPMRGTFTLKLRDFYNTEYHCYITPDYSVCELCTFRVREGNTTLNSWSIPECVSHEILMNRFQHVHFLYFQVSYSSQQADIDFEKIWQQRQQYMIKSSIV